MQHDLKTNPKPRWTELAHRWGDGADVTLLWSPGIGTEDDSIVICVYDARDERYFEIAAEPYLALEVYYHPFAYRDFSSGNDSDSSLAA